ncbi:MAG: putative acyl protein synthase/acyl-CoA reductase-like protein [Verrucomicrobiales bacterium]|nr:putative acyl protein synthase/acyl-CoA reductase-like protein [Verrucomicrobiales bacterium]
MEHRKNCDDSVEITQKFEARLWRKTSRNRTSGSKNRMKQFHSYRDFASQLLAFIASGKNDPDTFNELALGLYHLHVEHVPAYRKVCERVLRGSVPEHWSAIPSVPTTAFKDFELTSLAPQERTRVFHSSGTTEQRPSRHFHSPESLQIYEASLMRWFTGKFVEQGQAMSFISLTPPPSAAPNSSLVHMFGTIGKTHEMVFAGTIAGDRSWLVDAEMTFALVAMHYERSEPVAIVGTAFGFVHLLDAMAERNVRFNLPPGSRVMETGGYKGRSRVVPKTDLHAMIADRFGMSASQIISEYGMSELSSQAYDNSDRVFHFPPWARAQIISPETGREVADGETGLVRIFDLANVYSVLAIQTEDLAIRRDDGFELLGRASEAETRGCSLMATETALR